MVPFQGTNPNSFHSKSTETPLVQIYYHRCEALDERLRLKKDVEAQQERFFFDDFIELPKVGGFDGMKNYIDGMTQIRIMVFTVFFFVVGIIQCDSRQSLFKQAELQLFCCVARMKIQGLRNMEEAQRVCSHLQKMMLGRQAFPLGMELPACLSVRP